MSRKMTFAFAVLVSTGWIMTMIGCASVEGDDQNYRINNQDRELFETAPPGNDKIGAEADPMPVVSEHAIASANGQPTTLPGNEEVERPVPPPVFMDLRTGTLMKEYPPSQKHQRTTTTKEQSEQATYTGEQIEVHPGAGSHSEVEQVEAVQQATSVDHAEAEMNEVMEEEADAPSVSGIDRSHWRRIRVGPADGSVSHPPKYFEDHNRAKPIRQKLDFDDSLSTQAGAATSGADKASWMSDGNAEEIVTQPAKFGWDLLILPVKLVVQPVWSSETTPEPK